MASIGSLLKRPLCPSCYRRLFSPELPYRGPSLNQARGKKKLKKRETIKVRLLKDTVGYGPKGAIVPAPPGLFRNSWLPQQRAEYLSISNGRATQNVEAVKDGLFGREEEAPQAALSTEEAEEPRVLNANKAKVSTIAPDRSIMLLQSHLPATLTFHRALVSPLQPQSAPPSTAYDGDIEARARQIFGSVSAADIADSVRTVLSTTEAKDVPVSAENITLVSPIGASGEGIEGDRLKKLGQFDCEIKVKGSEEVVRRRVWVKAVGHEGDVEAEIEEEKSSPLAAEAESKHSRDGNKVLQKEL